MNRRQTPASGRCPVPISKHLSPRRGFRLEPITEFGITTLEQLKEVKEDTTAGGSLDQKAKLNDSGIRGATKQFDDLKVPDIEQAIAEANSPEGQAASKKSEKLSEAITKVEALREKVEKASQTEFDSLKTEVEA
jgi:hypothetical protein